MAAFNKPAILLFAALLLLQGCATAPRIPEAERASLGVIGVAKASFKPEPLIRRPAAGSCAGAGRGAAAGALTCIGAGFQGGNGYAASAGILLSPLGALIGCIYGVAAADTAEQVEADAAVIEPAVRGLDVQDGVAGRLMEAVAERTGREIVAIPEAGPASPDSGADIKTAAGLGVDTVVETSVLVYGITGAYSVDPPLDFVMTARFRVVKTGDGRVLYENTKRYNGGGVEFGEWAAGGGLLITSEFDKACSTVVNGAVGEMFAPDPDMPRCDPPFNY
ncbi:MAG: hypothetical protein HZA22_05895 [Nitrospirae bacterium]|nr:hypothetical protein [Nitrospirota bacterium]